MNVLQKLLAGTAAVTLLCVGLVREDARAQDAKDKPSPEAIAKAMAEAATPGAAHTRLEPLAGTWAYTCKMWMAPGAPAVDTKGTIERKWILGGRFLEEVYAGQGFDGKEGGFEGRGLLGYDNSNKKYTQTFVCNMGTAVQNGQGGFDASGKLTLSSEALCPLQQCLVKMRDEIRIESRDKIVIDSYVTVDGKEHKMMELVSIRKK